MFRFTSILVVTTTLTLATQVASAQSFLDRLEGIIGGQQAPPVTERRQPAYLGLTVDESQQSGIVVLEAEPNGPAARAGLRAGDRLLAIDDRQLTNVDSLARELQPLFAGDQLRVKYTRGGKQQTATLTLSAPPAQAPALERLERQFEELAPPPEPAMATTRGAFLGVRVVPLTDALRDRYNLAVSKGVVVETVSRDSPADRAGLAIGTAIVAFDGEPIDTPAELAVLLQTLRPGRDVEVSYYRGRQLIRTRVRLAATPPPEAPLRLGDDREPLLTEAPPPEPPLAEPFAGGPLPAGPAPRSQPIFEGERPAGRLLNQILEGVQQAQQQQAQQPPPVDNRELRQHVQLLEDYIDRLERRIAELEAELGRRGR